MMFRLAPYLLFAGVLTTGVPTPSAAMQPALQAPAHPAVRVTGVVRDESNGITLPGIAVEVLGTGDVAHTDLDGRYVLELRPGSYQLRVAVDGYQERILAVQVPAEGRHLTVNVGMAMARFSETVTVTAAAPAVTSSQELQLVERRNAQVITDNLGAQEMKANGDSDAAAAMSRVTGLSVVDGQYVFVRGLGERYSNTTLAGSILPTTEPDKKVVPLDLFPAGLLDSIQVNKSYSPDRSAEFAGGLVQITPIKFPSRAVLDFSYGLSAFSTATGRDVPLSPLQGSDVFGFDRNVRRLPASFPASKIVRRGIYTPDVGYAPEEITAFGRALDTSVWRPVARTAVPGQNWGAVFGNQFGRFGLVASVTHAYKEQFVAERRAFYRVADAGELEAVSDYTMQYGTQKAQLGVVGNLAYHFTPSHRVSLENFYSHSGRDEGRVFEGPNTENNFYYRNYRLQFVEEGLVSNALTGEHFFQGLRNSRVDWRVNLARATRDEPDLRETLYQSPFRAGSLEPTGAFVLADESQSGFRLFNSLDDDTVDAAINWSVFSAAGGRPTQIKFGASYVDRSREFQSRRFRYIPNVASSGGSVPVNLSLPPEEIFAPHHIGTAFRFNEETRPVDAYEGRQDTLAGYAMVDVAFTAQSRLIAGARVERSDQRVDSFDPFGLFERRVSSGIRNTDVFPAVNLVQALGADTTLRVSYSATVNRPEFRELAEFEFTDVVGSRAVRGNPSLERALIQNVDARLETFSGGRNVLAASAFYKHFDAPIERVVIAGAQPIVTFQNADTARNLGLELEAGRQLFDGLFVNANYTFVHSEIALRPEQRTVQTSTRRALAGQSKNLLNLIAEYSAHGFSGRLLVNYFGDRISDVGSNQAPDIVENGRPTIDVVAGQRIGRMNVRFSVENLTDADYVFTQGAEAQRTFRMGRTYAVSLGVQVF